MARKGFILVFVKVQQWTSAPINLHKYTLHYFRTRFDIKFVPIPLLQRIPLFVSPGSVRHAPRISSSPIWSLIMECKLWNDSLCNGFHLPIYSLHVRSRYCLRHPDFNILYDEREVSYPYKRKE